VRRLLLLDQELRLGRPGLPVGGRHSRPVLGGVRGMPGEARRQRHSARQHVCHARPRRLRTWLRSVGGSGGRTDAIGWAARCRASGVRDAGPRPQEDGP
jgi:hypothetical protein